MDRTAISERLASILRDYHVVAGPVLAMQTLEEGRPPQVLLGELGSAMNHLAVAASLSSMERLDEAHAECDRATLQVARLSQMGMRMAFTARITEIRSVRQLVESVHPLYPEDYGRIDKLTKAYRADILSDSHWAPAAGHEARHAELYLGSDRLLGHLRQRYARAIVTATGRRNREKQKIAWAWGLGLALLSVGAGAGYGLAVWRPLG
jgi:hypothetical protein